MSQDVFGARGTLETAGGPVDLYRLDALGGDLARAPHTVRILTENLLRRAGGRDVSEQDVAALAAWPAAPPAGVRTAFMPARVLMQDFTGVPAVVDIAAVRSAVARAGRDASAVNPSVAVDLIIDHSIQVDEFGTRRAYHTNIEWEYRRNSERYALLRWAQQAFDDFRVVPPGRGICHQVNLEYLARVVRVKDGVAHSDTLLGTDSHTTMVNGVSVLGWGVGGIEAEAAMLGQPMFLPWPVVAGVRTTGALPEGTTATDLVLTLTQMLRAHGMVGKFVEFFGAGLSNLRVEDRATLSNMCPEYGATAAYFPVDDRTFDYLRNTNRGDVCDLVERYAKEQGLFRTDQDPDPVFDEVLELDLSAVEPSMAGPRRPQDRSPLPRVWDSFKAVFGDRLAAEAQAAAADQADAESEDESQQDGYEGFGTSSPEARLGAGPARPGTDGQEFKVRNGSVVIAAITSCTNTSNPSVMLAAGLLAKKAVEAGLHPGPWVKTSLAPGSRVVTDYLDRAGLTPYLEKLGFNLVGYGCTTCIGNSGPLSEEVSRQITENDLAAVSVLSGNRNFEGRIHPLVRASYLASPPLVVAFGLAGRLDVDLTTEPVGRSPEGRDVYLRDLWPSPREVAEAMRLAISPEQFEREYAQIFEGDEHWKEMAAPTGAMFDWDPDSTYVREPPFFQDLGTEAPPFEDIVGARVLVKVGDSVTTDHISPAGAIKADSPAGRYLQEEGVEVRDFNSYGSRRGNHQVMMRGTFANVRLRNELAPGTEGPWTTHQPSGERMTIFDASERYRAEGVPLLVIAGREYGSGSSRDWAAKGPALLGVRAVIAQGFERIHRSNLIGMGVLPLQFVEGEGAASLGLDGTEEYGIGGLSGGIAPRQEVTVGYRRTDGSEGSFKALVRIDGPAEVDYYRSGGILQMVTRGLLQD